MFEKLHKINEALTARVGEVMVGKESVTELALITLLCEGAFS